jgi:integrase
LKRYLGELRDRDLADNTIHGFFEVLRAFTSWADREGYPVDAALPRVRAPMVAQKEVETYSRDQLEKIFDATAPGWPLTAVKILLGTGMRLSELCGLMVEDFEDDGESAFLKVRHGKDRLRCPRPPLPPHLRHRLPAAGWGDRATPADPRPHDLRHGHARPAGARCEARPPSRPVPPGPEGDLRLQTLARRPSHDLDADLDRQVRARGEKGHGQSWRSERAKPVLCTYGRLRHLRG